MGWRQKDDIKYFVYYINTRHGGSERSEMEREGRAEKLFEILRWPVVRTEPPRGRETRKGVKRIVWEKITVRVPGGCLSLNVYTVEATRLVAGRTNRDGNTARKTK